MGIKWPLLLVVMVSCLSCYAESRTDQLIQAIAENDISAVSSLAKDKSTLNSPGDEGLTPLQMASAKGNFNLTSLLIKSGADINQINKHNHSALSLASQKGHIKIVKLLLESGAKVNDKGLATPPLVSSAMMGHTAVVKELLKNGARDGISSSLVSELKRVGRVETATLIQNSLRENKK